MMRPWWWGGLIVCAMAAAALARPGTVHTMDGRIISGDVEEHEDAVNVTVKGGIEIALPRTQVLSIEYTESFEQQYRQKLSQLSPHDATGRVELGRWALANGHYDLAIDALEAALKLEPKNQDALLLLETARSQMRLAAQPPAQPEAQPGTPPTAPAVPAAGEATAAQPLLTPEEINVVRQRELKASDSAVRIQIDENVRRKFIDATGRDPAGFFKLPVLQQAMTILREGDPKLWKGIRVLSDPSSILEYRRNVQPLILAGCATSNCHGSSAGRPLVLHNPANSDQATYTNFVILENYRKAVPASGATQFGGGDVAMRLINRAQPDRSLLAQYGLPHEAADTFHPNVAGWHPIFQSRQDPNFREVMHWMGESLFPVDPGYDDMLAASDEAAPAPTTAPTTAPAEAPATAPAPAK